jgi:vacuolar-type H+-ATPase catalytic subunit A/Vma1
MRSQIIAIALGCSLVVAPGAGLAAPQKFRTNKQQCRRMTKQITHYESVVLKLANDRGNQLWANATSKQIDRLKHQRADHCPEWGKERSRLQRAAENAAKMQRMMKLAAKGAMKYFSGGLW